MERNRLHKNLVRTMLLVVMILLCLPIVLNLLPVKIPVRPVDEDVPDATFSWKAWFNGGYQETKNAYIENAHALRPFLKRFYNQLDFELFKKLHSRDAIVGRDNYMFEAYYIRTYLGEDYVGDSTIHANVKHLKEVQDAMAKRNKLFMFVFAPGKASFYPEYIPCEIPAVTGKTNYKQYKKEILNSEINHIDFNDYFIRQKHVSKYPLYPKFGIHWSDYGSILATDSILRYIEKHYGTDLPDQFIVSTKISAYPQGSDRDILDGIKLLEEPVSFPMAYLRAEVKTDSTKNKGLKLIVISDSFWWQVYNSGRLPYIFKHNQFWYYNEEIYPESFTTQLKVKNSDYYKRLNEADVVIILQTEATLKRFGNGFVNMGQEVFCHPNPDKQNIQEMKEAIYSNKKWYNEVVKKSGERNISLDSMITLDAIFVLDRDKKGK